MLALILALAPIAAEMPKQQPAYVVMVDFVVINRVRTFSTETDAWGRPKTIPHETIWISFYDRSVATFIPVVTVGRGWWLISSVRSIVECSDGWLIESVDGIGIITPEIRLIDSPFDWEMRNRRIFWPIRRP